MTITIERMSVVEWYDAPVSAAISAVNGARFFILLLAFDPKTLKRLYAVTEISDKMYVEIEEAKTEISVSAVFKKLEFLKESIYFSSEIPKAGYLFSFSRPQNVSLDESIRPSFPYIEKAVSGAAITKWL